MALRFFLSLLLWAGLAQPVLSECPLHLVVFGDSLSAADPGSAPVFGEGGRYTNGRVWVEYLQPQALLNYAMGGACANASYCDTHWGPRMSLKGQVDTYLGEYPSPLENHTGVVFIGANDAKNIIWKTSMSPTDADYKAVVGAIMQQVARLFHAGMRSILVLTTIDAGQAPFVPPEIRSNVTAICTKFDALLAEAMVEYPTSGNASLLVVDYFTAFRQAVALTYNFTEVNNVTGWLKGPCVNGFAVFGHNYTCPAEPTFFFDDFHPTTLGHQAVAEQLAPMICGSPIPSPSPSVTEPPLPLPSTFPSGALRSARAFFTASVASSSDAPSEVSSASAWVSGVAAACMGAFVIAAAAAAYLKCQFRAREAVPLFASPKDFGGVPQSDTELGGSVQALRGPLSAVF